MNVTYGQGVLIQDNSKFEGTIILSEHKILITRQGVEISQSFIPLEKIERIKLAGNRLSIDVRPAIMSRYQAVCEADRKNITDLAQEIVRRRGFKKRFLINEWYEVSS